jgi:hypothetical protein
VVGNAIVVPVIAWSGNIANLVFQASDNYGNSYELVPYQPNGSMAVLVWHCRTVLTTGASFSITITSSYPLGNPLFYAEFVAIEVTDIGTYLSVDQVKSATGSNVTAASTGVTAALTAADIFEVAVLEVAGAQSLITVDSVSPPWTQEHEHLTFDTTTGEIVSRTLTGASGTTQSCGWTYSTARDYLATLVAFKTNTGTPPPFSTLARVSQVTVEVAVSPSAASTTAQVSQVAVEVAVATDASATKAQLSQVAVEIAYIPGPPHVTQDVVELLYEPIPASRVTQQVVELLSQQTSPIRTTQNVVELLRDSGTAKAWLTQAVVETLSLPSPAGRLSHVVIETLTLATTAGRLSQVVVETLTLPSPAGRLSHLVIETLQYDPQVLPTGGALNTISMGEMIGNLWVE